VPRGHSSQGGAFSKAAIWSVSDVDASHHSAAPLMSGDSGSADEGEC